MMRITRDDEQYIGRARPALHSRVKVGFKKDGRITAIDGLAIVDNGPYDVVSDARSAGDHISLSYQPLAMRWRTLSVLTNTPPRGAQRAPGGMQGNALMEPIIAKAARKLGIDQVAIHRINAPEGKAPFGAPNARGAQNYDDQRVPEGSARQGRRAVRLGGAKGAQRPARRIEGPRRRRGGQRVLGRLDRVRRPVRHQAGRPMQIQSGIGNLGTESVFDVHRVAAEIVGMPWEKVDITWGNTAKYLPSTCNQGGSQTTHAMTRAAHAAGMDAKTQAAGDCRQDIGRRARGVRGRRRARVQRRARHDAGAGGAARRSSSAASTTVMSCPKTSTPSPRPRRRRWPGRD